MTTKSLLSQMANIRSKQPWLVLNAAVEDHERLFLEALAADKIE